MGRGEDGRWRRNGLQSAIGGSGPGVRKRGRRMRALKVFLAGLPAAALLDRLRAWLGW